LFVYFEFSSRVSSILFLWYYFYNNHTKKLQIKIKWLEDFDDDIILSDSDNSVADTGLIGWIGCGTNIKW